MQLMAGGFGGQVSRRITARIRSSRARRELVEHLALREGDVGVARPRRTSGDHRSDPADPPSTRAVLGHRC